MLSSFLIHQLQNYTTAYIANEAGKSRPAISKEVESTIIPLQNWNPPWRAKKIKDLRRWIFAKPP